MPNLASFLTVGYFLDSPVRKYQVNIEGIDKTRYRAVAEGDLIERGIALWREAISTNFEPRRVHVVPISGGLDSRAILAALLEHTEAHNVHTYTFGSPGTLDYDIGSLVARRLGTRHTAFDLTQYAFNQEELEDVSRRVDRQTVLFHHCPVWDVGKRFKGAVIWSGFLGDPISGSHLPTDPAQGVAGAVEYFFKKNRFVTSTDLNFGRENLAELLDPPSIEAERLTFEEQLDLKNRQAKLVAPHVLMNGFEYRTPFCYQPWIDFLLSQDKQRRSNQALYKKILLQAFPVAFSLKTKTNRGLPLNAHPFLQNGMRLFRGAQRLFGQTSWSVNYLDFNEAIRCKPDLRTIVERNLKDLERRRLIDWLNVLDLLANHQRGRVNCADALLVLASLEIHLKTGLDL